MSDTDLKEFTHSNKYDLLASWKKTNGIIVNIFVVVVIAIFPLFFHDFYYDISSAKYKFYYGTVILMTVVMLTAAIYYLYSDWNYYQWQNVKKLIRGLSIKSLRMCDWAMMGFVLAAAISTFQSEYFYEAFWGNEGRYMGLFLILLYGVSYFAISRFFVLRTWHLDVFFVAGIIACLIGILQYFYIDPLGFKKEILLEQYKSFASTFGNINTYTSYVALIAGAGIAAFVIEEKLVKKRWYFLVTIVSLFALITGISDNAYLSMAAVFGLIPLYLFKDLKGVKKYVLTLSVLFTEFQAIDIVNQAFPEKVLGISSLFNIIAGYKFLPIIVAALWGITISLYIADSKVEKSRIRRGSNVLRWFWLIIVVIVIFAICYVLYDVNVLENVGKYGSLSNYLMIDDDWGSARGYVWRISIERFKEFPLIHKLFGYGPDTFGILTVMNYYDEMARNYGVIFDSAHNEYLQYLVTMGIVGLSAYLWLLLTSAVQIVRTAKKKPELIALVFALLCYGAQALVNISVPIVSPIMLTLLMMGVAIGNKMNDDAER